MMTMPSPSTTTIHNDPGTVAPAASAPTYSNKSTSNIGSNSIATGNNNWAKVVPKVKIHGSAGVMDQGNGLDKRDDDFESSTAAARTAAASVWSKSSSLGAAPSSSSLRVLAGHPIPKKSSNETWEWGPQQAVTWEAGSTRTHIPISLFSTGPT
jgi:hypothetical protein